MRHASKPPSGRVFSPGDDDNFTPPLPPRVSRKQSNSLIRTSTNDDAVNQSKSRRKRDSPGSVKSSPPNLPPRVSRKNSETEVSRPAKRRRLSQGSAPPSPGSQSMNNSLRVS